MEIETKDELFQVLKDLQAKNSEISERLDNLTPTQDEGESEDESEGEEETEERSEEELDEIEQLLTD